MNRSQLRMQLLLQHGFDCIGDHQVSLALHDLIEDSHIVAVYDDFGLFDMGPRKALVGSTGVDDHSDARLVDLFKSLKPAHIFFQGYRRLPVSEIVDAEKGGFLAAEID